MNEQVYKKAGRKYVPVGYSDGWTGFPTDGIWLVQSYNGYKSSECIIKIDELDSIKPAVNFILGYKEKLLKFLQEELEKENPNIKLHNESINEFSLRLLKEISK